MITQKELIETFEYRDGNLYWKKNRQSIKAGNKAGCVNPSTGYELITVNQKRYRTHQLIYMMFNGFFVKELDHKDENRLNNKIENLRIASRPENCYRIKNHRNTSGYRNVTFSKQTNKWIVRININGKSKNFGHFDDIELADLVAQEARDKYHGNFAYKGA
jgi:hypothetical protein